MKHFSHFRRGVTLAPVLIFVLGFVTIGVSVLTLSSSYNRSAKKTVDKWQSDALAESAANILYDQIRTQMLADLTYPFVLNENSMENVKPDGTKDIIGRYSARLVQDREVQTDMNEGGNRFRRYTYHFTIEGRGRATGGVESIVQVKYRAQVDRWLVLREITTSTPPPDVFSFPAGAIVANSRVNIKTNQGLRTFAPNGLDGFVIGNEGISWTPASGSKSSYTNPNIIDIQGYYLVPDGAAYTFTLSKDGLGNDNGSKNYRSPAAAPWGTFPGAPANSIIKLNGSVSFAPPSTVDVWTRDWQRAATAYGSNYYNGNVDSGSLVGNSNDDDGDDDDGDDDDDDGDDDDDDGKKRIQCPAMINGNLRVRDGQVIEFFPASKDPRKNIVYIKGDVENKGQLINHGCTVVFEGKYTDDTDAEYKLLPDPLTFKTREDVMQKSCLLSTKQDANAFEFKTNSSAIVGNVYAAKGGIRVRGSAEFTGMLLAGGSGAAGDINIEPAGGNSFVVRYDPYCANAGDIVVDAESVIDSSFVPGNIYRNYLPTKMFNWVFIK